MDVSLAPLRRSAPVLTGRLRKPAGKDVKVELEPGCDLQRQDSKQKQQTGCPKFSRVFGLDTWLELVWEDWDEGKEFTKTLVIKNVQNKLQKLQVRPPKSSFFSTSSPEMLLISPGTSLSVPVTFKPLKRCEYEDSIEFCGTDGNFQVNLRATLPRHSLYVPASVNLPLCAVQHSSHTNFILKNNSKLNTFFQWECALPFQLRPEHGLLSPSQECLISVTFLPQEALVYQRKAYCWFGDEAESERSCCTVLLKALAKYPYLQLRNHQGEDDEENPVSVLEFGPVALGQRLQKSFDVFNPSPATASFTLSVLADGSRLFGSEFSTDITNGEVVPGRSQKVVVTYSPSGVLSTSVEFCSLQCRGVLNNKLIRLTGSCIGPKVSLSASVLDFGCVKEGEAATRSLELINSSAAAAAFQWDIDCNGNSVFRFQPPHGTVLPHSHITLKADYCPTQPIAHYRRVACLVLHGDPVYIDLVGTCHSELQHPAILKPEHLMWYKLHWLPEASCNALQQQNSNGRLDQKGVWLPAEKVQSEIDGAPVRSSMEEFFQTGRGNMDDVSSTPRSVSVVPNELLFLPIRKSSEPTLPPFSKCVSITNHSSGKLSLVWTVSQDSTFSIHPSSGDLAPLKSTSFKVTYNPKQVNSLHGAELECFAYSKTNAVIGDEPLCPPWCVTVRVIGHSFQPGKKHFLPVCSLKPPKVVFPPLSVTSYRTVLLQNDGDSPLTFCLECHSNPGLAQSLLAVPSCGFIQPAGHQILTIRSSPTEDGPIEGNVIQIKLNAADCSRELRVVSVVEKPRLSLEGGTTLYFQPTDVGSQAQRVLQITNCSCLPIRLEWSISDPDQKLISVQTDVGEVPANDILAQTWCFAPQEEKTYTVEATLSFWYSQSDGSNKSHLSLTVIGMGAAGFIEAAETCLDMGSVLVGSYSSVEVPLVNSSPCPVSFHLTIKQELEDDTLVSDEPIVLQLDNEKGTIASHSTLQLRASVQPRRQAQYIWTISYQKIDPHGMMSSPAQIVCEVRAKGVFPTLQVMDVCATGCLGQLSKAHLWKLFSLDGLNKQLRSDPSSAELRLSTQHSWSRVFTKIRLDFNFSCSPVNSDTSSVMLMFHNPGSFPVDWAFLLPEDQHMELEYWALTGQFSSAELSQMKMQGNKPFSVAPRSATLLPGQKRAVNFSYCHDFVGAVRFPVVFKLSHGREILINFKGVTVGRGKPSLYFYSRQHVFSPVTIGDSRPPKQKYELYNGGEVPVMYKVDSAVLSQLQMDNYNHPVLRCLNPEGEVGPGKTASLNWIFSPLEAKMYHIDVPIHIRDGETTLVMFEGLGCNTLGLPRAPPQCISSDSIHGVHRVPFPGQILFLSEDNVLLGDIPVGSKLSRIFFLTNVSYTDTVFFTWILPQQEDEQVVQVQPDRGRLSPGECTLCALTFVSTQQPTVYQLDLTCQVFQEAALIQYQRDLHCWEEERERQRNEFVITDKSRNSTNSPIIVTEEERLTPPLKTGPPLRKYKTLPPITGKESSTCTRAERRLQREAARVWRRPRAPEPTLLHLEVAARTHGLLQYQTHFPDQFEKLYRYQISVKTNDKMPVQLPEKDHMEHILTSLLRDILDDSTFFQFLSPSQFNPNTCQVSSSDSPSAPSRTLVPTCSSSLGAESPGGDRKRLSGRLGITSRKKKPDGIQSAPADMIDDILTNTLQNLMMEAVRGELLFCTTAFHQSEGQINDHRRGSLKGEETKN